MAQQQVCKRPSELSLLMAHCSGVLLDNAQELLRIPELTEGDLVQRFAAAMNDALAYGLTSVHDAGLDPTSLEFFIRSVVSFINLGICRPIYTQAGRQRNDPGPSECSTCHFRFLQY